LHGENARRIQQLIHIVETDRLDVENIQADIDTYEDDNELSEQEMTELLAITRRSKQAKQVFYNPSIIYMLKMNTII